MTLNDTPSGERIRIAFFGLRNAGKSSLVNAFLGQNLCIVSPVAGTTTDPVSKAMELLPLGPVLVTDTPGIDDEGGLGDLRKKKAFEAMAAADVAVLVTDAQKDLSKVEKDLLSAFRREGVPCVRARSKADQLAECPRDDTEAEIPEIWTSALKGWGVRALREAVCAMKRPAREAPGLVEGLVQPGSTVLLIVPVDSAAPKGRLILPQQQAIRDILDAGARALVVKEDGIAQALAGLKALPACAVTDSQVFAKAAQAVPESVPLTSFSILMARRKGFLEEAVRGVAMAGRLKDGDTVLIAEGCTHHRQCGDIGTVKIPRWLRQSTGKNLQFKTVSGREFPDDCSPYALVVCCGGCMLSPREAASRIRCATRCGVEATNFGVLIAAMQGVLARSLSVFPHLLPLLGDGASPAGGAASVHGKAERRPAPSGICRRPEPGIPFAPDAQPAPEGPVCQGREGEQLFARSLDLVLSAYARAGGALDEGQAPRRTADGLESARRALCEAEPGLSGLALVLACAGLARDMGQQADSLQYRLERLEAAGRADSAAFGALAESLNQIKGCLAKAASELCLVRFRRTDAASVLRYERLIGELRQQAGVRIARAGGTLSAAGLLCQACALASQAKALAVWQLQAMDLLRSRGAGQGRARRALRLAEIWARAVQRREADVAEIASRHFDEAGRAVALAAEPLLDSFALAGKALRLLASCWALDGEDEARGAVAGREGTAGKEGAHA